MTVATSKDWTAEPPFDPDYDAPVVTPRLEDELLDRADLANLPTPDPLIHGVLTRHAYALLSGRDGTGKSFIGLDWACCIATGKAWQSHTVERGPVLYIAAEGAFGLDQRLTAWEKAWQRTIPAGALTVLPRAVNLFRNPDETAQLLDLVRRRRYVFVVVDTLHRSSTGADGNSTDMGVVVDSIDRLRRATDQGTVLVIAHTDAADTKTRGFTGVEDDADIVYRVRETEGVIRLWRDKNKDGPRDHETYLRLAMQAGSCVVESHVANLYGDELSERQQQILDALREMYAATGATAPTLMETTELSKSTVSYALNKLLERGLVENIGTKTRPHWIAATSNDVQPDSHAQRPIGPTVVQPPSNDQRNVQSSPTTLKGLDLDVRSDRTTE